MRKSKAGFSILEVVVAFAIIMIVSIVACTIFATSGKNIVGAVDEKSATTYLTNALEIYKYYGDIEDVKTELDLSSPNEDGYFTKQFGSYTVKFKIDGDGFSGDCYLKDDLIFDILPYKKGVFANESD